MSTSPGEEGGEGGAGEGGIVEEEWQVEEEKESWKVVLQ